MEPESLTLKVLIDVREEARGASERLEQANVYLGAIEHAVREATNEVRLLGLTLRAARPPGIFGADALKAIDERFAALERRVTELERGAS